MTFQDLTKEMAGLYGEGKYAEALDLVDRRAAQFPERSALIAFWRMCLLSLCGRTQDVLTVFRQALEQGAWWQESQFNDSDLDAVRDLPEFKQLVRLSQDRYLRARANTRPHRCVLLPDETAGPLPLLIALHGHGGNAELDLPRWEVARQRGWMVLSPQSTQPFTSYSSVWDDPQQGLADIAFHYEEVLQNHKIDPERVVVGGFSQGSGMALISALSGKIPAQGFIGIGTWWENVEELLALASGETNLRAYFVTGKKDHTLERSREIQDALRAMRIAVAEETHPEIGHEFSVDFATSFEKALDFIF
jgi:predicted esterase